MRIVAVDWSGKFKRAEEFLWLAEVRDGRVVDLSSGLSRPELVARLIEMARDDPRMVVGLDFAFSFPRWWCVERGWSTGREVWSGMQAEGEHLLATCEPPLWGRPGKPNPHSKEQRFRRTDLEDNLRGAKSVFQIGGAGAVGTGSIRGMPHLLTLAANGFTVWPFEPCGVPAVVEIYPRALTGPVNKSRWADRHAYLLARFPEQPRDLIERAAGSEDAFDAAVSALVMGAHAAKLETVPSLAEDVYRIEGKIWRPS